MAWEARSGLKLPVIVMVIGFSPRLNGLGSPFGIETRRSVLAALSGKWAKWPGKPVRD